MKCAHISSISGAVENSRAKSQVFSDEMRARVRYGRPD